MENSIVRMTREHLPEVRLLIEQLGYQTTTEELDQRLDNHSGLFIIWSDGKVAGFIHLMKVDLFISPARAEIKTLVVEEKFRGKGLGKELINFAKTWARMHQLGTIRLSSNIMRERAHAFYEREGFRRTKTSHYFEIEV